MYIKKEKLDVKSINKKRLILTALIMIAFVIVSFICVHIIVEETELYTKIFTDGVTRMYIFALKVQLTLFVVPIIIGYVISTFKLISIIKVILITYALMASLIYILFIVMFILPL